MLLFPLWGRQLWNALKQAFKQDGMDDTVHQQSV